MNKLLKISFLIVFVVLLIDQALKIWIKSTMMIGEEFPVFGNWFIMHFVENNGMAFGMELAGEFGKLFLSVFRIVAVGGIGYYIYKLTQKETPVGLIICVSLVLAGALGNIIDSAFYGLIFDHSHGQVASFMPEGGGYATFLHGKVVDMFYFPILRGTYPDWLPFVGGNDFLFFRPVFNFADSAISVGIFILLIFYRNHFKDHESEEKA
ncbi:MAG: lipoprotein signal peptidase [Breznakibacter sp.]